MSAGGKEIVMVGGGGREFAALAESFRSAGREVLILSDAEETKKRLAMRQPSLVVVLQEGAGDPLETVRELVFLFRGTPIVAASAKGGVAEARAAIDAGAADYVMLPASGEVIQGLLGRYADQFFDPELGRGRHLISADAGMQRLLTQVRRAAQSKATVLIQGESGTGKELIARFIHQVSERRDGPFVAVNCAALPENLLESELFGHAKGAFTGAMADRKGKFLQAQKGTILLDEISEMSLNLQAKLLRVLQEGEVDPVGGRSPIQLDVRVLASTNRDLKGWASDGRFREDLFYRLNVFPVRLPPLRERPGDVVLLAEHFRKRFVAELGRNDIRFSPEAMAALRAYAWPGNIRELENVIQRALLVAEGLVVSPLDLMIEGAAVFSSSGGDTGAWEPPPAAVGAAHHGAAAAAYGRGGGGFGATAGSGAGSVGGSGGGAGIHLPVGTTVREMEEILIRRTLDEVAGNRTRAAELLGISIRTLRNKLNEYDGRGPADE
ncbi:MAG: sigma-54-dependent Fis family transcriptional regulator [Magnetococcales bacterium]|nr:sigma-54-dependent Fis family transcriptional regulator [Magnetococcales bacterium]